MGIQGLLPLLKSIQRPTELKKYSGETFGVDAYGWLHRGAVSCAIELAEGKPTRRYVDFAMNRVRMLRYFGIKPYLVFDGGYLPSKASTEASREKRREECRKAGLELLKAGKPSQAHAELQKAVDITPEMARHLIEELKKAGVPYVVAPYEADPQLVFLEREGHISGILSEDSDLLVFGAKRLLTKLDQHGQCIEINRRDFCACREVSLTGWTDTQFRQMAILSGCDYLDSISNLGLKTAHRMMRKHKTPERVIRMLQFDGKYRVPTEYPNRFRQAEQTFLYQWVFCPKSNKLVHFTDIGPDIEVNELPFIGPFIEPEIARGIAVGDINPITKQTIVLPTPPSPRKRTASGTVLTEARTRTAREPAGKPIDSYFQGHRRIPLGEMDSNCFTIDPARVSALTNNGDRPIVYPLPRPYIGGTAPTPAAPRPYINRSEGSSRTLRRRTEPVTSVLGNGGRSLASVSRRQTTGLVTDVTGSSGSLRSAQPVRPPKKARLCDDSSSGSSPSKQKSKFFSPSNAKSPVAKKSEKYLMSDDSIEDVLNDLPEFGVWKSSPKGRKEIAIYQEKSISSATTTGSDGDGLSMAEGSNKPAASVLQESKSPSTPAIAERFAYAPRASSESTSGQSQLQRQSTSSARSSLYSHTPASSIASSQPSTAKTTPATPHMTPLQRLGARALSRNNKQPHTPVSTVSRTTKRPSNGRPSLDSLPINPAFIPLPPVDLEEVEALNGPIGSEDLMMPESDNDEPRDGLENLAKAQSNNKAGCKKLNLSSFLFT
ncbi:hypothetical protein GGS26DRAFT_511553 [Hypomontagnella submonticulosa]|nr:hypothetical protein GGS26DRAFT_511553 [Hypomontagnella submonticulosa]